MLAFIFSSRLILRCYIIEKKEEDDEEEEKKGAKKGEKIHVVYLLTIDHHTLKKRIEDRIQVK